MSVQFCLQHVGIIVQSSEAGLNPFVVHIVRETQILIEVAVSQYLIVCLDDGVKQVGEHDGHVYAPPVLEPQWSARLGFWVTCANGDAIVETL